MPFLPYYVEAGLDGLQAFQFAAGNDFEFAKKTYGDKLCFFTGIDVQLAQTRTPKEIREDALRAWRIGKEGSGFVLATTHNVQPVTPYENIMEMIDTVHDIQSGRYD
jgi:uroporphyrinogen decarboxylase